MTTNETMPCPFERGQVWENPDNEIMMVINVRREKDGYKVNYVSEDAEPGSFWDTNRAIIENIALVQTGAQPNQAQDADAVSAAVRDAVFILDAARLAINTGGKITRDTEVYKMMCGALAALRGLGE